MNLRVENASQKAKLDFLTQSSKNNNKEMLECSMLCDSWRYKFEQLLEASKVAGFVFNFEPQSGEDEKSELDLSHSNSNSNNSNLITDMRHEIQMLKVELENARVDKSIARATAQAVVMGDGNLTLAAQLALSNAHSGAEAEAEAELDVDTDTTRDPDVRLASELNTINGEIQHKEHMEKKLNMEREAMNTLKAHFEGCMARLTEEVEALSTERNVLLDKLEKPGSSKLAATSKLSQAENKKMRERLAELQDRIKHLNKKSGEHARSLKMREVAEKRCEQLKLDIEADKKKKVALQKRMRDEMEGRRLDKRAADQRAAVMLRQGDRLKTELNKVKEAAARQAAVLKRKATEAVAKQKQLADQRKRQIAHSSKSTTTTSNNKISLTNLTLGSQRKKDLNEWLEDETEITVSAKSIQLQLEDQAHLRSLAAEKRDEMIGKKLGYNTSKEVSILEMELETRTGVIKQLQRSLSELDRASRAADAKIVADTKSSNSNSSNTCWNMFTKNETKFVLAKTFDALIESKIEHNKINAKLTANTDTAVESALDDEKAKNRKMLKEMELKHSEAMMTLLEATKGAVEQNVAAKVMEAAGEGAGGIDENCKNAVDDMLVGFLSGCEAMTSDLTRNMEDFMEEERKLKAKNEKKKQAELEKKKRTKFNKWVEFSSEEESDDESFVSAEDDSDEEWELPGGGGGGGRKKGGGGGGKKTITTEKKATISSLKKEVNVVVNLDELPSVTEMEKMKVAELKQYLRALELPVSGKKEDLILRLSDKGGKEEKKLVVLEEESASAPALATALGNLASVIDAKPKPVPVPMRTAPPVPKPTTMRKKILSVAALTNKIAKTHITKSKNTNTSDNSSNSSSDLVAQRWMKIEQRKSETENHSNISNGNSNCHNNSNSNTNSNSNNKAAVDRRKILTDVLNKVDSVANSLNKPADLSSTKISNQDRKPKFSL